MKKPFLGTWARICAFVGMITVMSGSAMADIVEYDSTTGGVAGVTFNPGELITPIITVVIACLTAGAALWLISIGTSWLKQLAKGK